MKRLFLVFLGIMAVAGLGFAGRSTDFKSKFPAYAAVFTNVDTVEFFTGTSGTLGTLSDNVNYYQASASGVVSCIEDNLSSLPSTYTINGSSSSGTLACNFYPNAVSNSGFTVTGYTTLTPAATSDTDATDGELLVITNSSSFTVSGSVTSGSAPSYMTIKAFPGYQANDQQVYQSGGNPAAAQAVNSFSVDENYAFNTDYAFAKVIPLVFYAEVSDVLSTSEQSTLNTFTVTWNGSAP